MKQAFLVKTLISEVQYDDPLIQKTFIKSFKTGLRDDILAANLRPILRLPSGRVNLAVACEKRTAKVNTCEVGPCGNQTAQKLQR